MKIDFIYVIQWITLQIRNEGIMIRIFFNEEELNKFILDNKISLTQEFRFQIIGEDLIFSSLLEFYHSSEEGEL